MTEPLSLVSIVEGDGEVQALPILLRRLAVAIAPECSVVVHPPMRVPRANLVKADELERYVELATRQHGGQGAVIVLIDADDDCAAALGPKLLARAEVVRPGSLVAVVLAVKEYEAWFLAAAASIAGRRGLADDLASPSDPEAIRDAKGWLQARRTDGLAYSPNLDQPALSGLLDLELARSRSASFDKLWRELERILASFAATGAG